MVARDNDFDVRGGDPRPRLPPQVPVTGKQVVQVLLLNRATVRVALQQR